MVCIRHLFENRYCNKQDIAEQYKEYFEYFSEYELFLTELTNILFMDCITRSFTVLALEEFDKLDEVPLDTYFCRGSYDMRKAKMTPAIEDWKKTCVCQKPLNPVQLITCSLRTCSTSSVKAARLGTTCSALG